MFICRLFQRDRPFEQLEARLIPGGEVTIGRDPSADWVLNDPEALLSRIHCALTVSDGRLLLRDQSTNGTFLENGERVPRDVTVELQPGQSLELGGLTLLIDLPPQGAGADLDGTRIEQGFSPSQAPHDWTDGPHAPAGSRGGSLLEAFCEGAKLDASALSGHDPAEVMKRVGAIYQQTVLALATLMADRARLKAEYDLERTTIGAMDNNPFKWSPTRQLAQDLLCRESDGFLSHAEAVRASFQDISQHMAALAEGASAAASEVVQTLSPDAIEAEAQSQGFSLQSRPAVRWEIFKRRYAALTAEQRSSMGAAFGGAYERVMTASQP